MKPEFGFQFSKIILMILAVTATFASIFVEDRITYLLVSANSLLWVIVVYIAEAMYDELS